MSNFVSRTQDCVILSGQTSSNVMTRDDTQDARLIGIKAPATLPETTVIQVCDTPDGTFATLNNGTADVAGPTAGKACEYDPFAFKYWKLLANGAVAADRTFEVTKVWNAY